MKSFFNVLFLNPYPSCKIALATLPSLYSHTKTNINYTKTIQPDDLMWVLRKKVECQLRPRRYTVAQWFVYCKVACVHLCLCYVAFRVHVCMGGFFVKHFDVYDCMEDVDFGYKVDDFFVF